MVTAFSERYSSTSEVLPLNNITESVALIQVTGNSLIVKSPL